MVQEKLNKGLNLRISPSEMTMLDELSDAIGLPKGAIVRQLIRREHAAKFGEKPLKRRAKR
jgi:hypothetical protein